MTTGGGTEVWLMADIMCGEVRCQSSHVARCVTKGILIIKCRQMRYEGHPYNQMSPDALRRASLSSRVARCVTKGILIITCRQMRYEGHPYRHVSPDALRRASLSSRVARCPSKGILMPPGGLTCELNVTTARNPQHSKTNSNRHRNIP